LLQVSIPKEVPVEPKARPVTVSPIPREEDKLLTATQQNNLTEVTRILESNYVRPFSIVDDTFTTPLSVALQNSSLEIFKILLKWYEH